MTIGTIFPRAGGALASPDPNIALHKVQRGMISNSSSLTINVTGVPSTAVNKTLYVYIPKAITTTSRTINAVRIGSTYFTRVFGAASTTAQDTIWALSYSGTAASFSVTIGLSGNASITNIGVFAYSGLTAPNTVTALYTSAVSLSYPINLSGAAAVFGKHDINCGFFGANRPYIVDHLTGYNGGYMDEWGFFEPVERYEIGVFGSVTDGYGSMVFSATDDPSSAYSAYPTMTIFSAH